MKCKLFKSGVTITTNGSVKPCCIYRAVKPVTLADDWKSEFEFKSKQLEAGWIPECIQCQKAEERGDISDRLDAEELLEGTAYEMWDLKLNNTCNLSCRMCSPHSSSTFQKNVNANASENWAPIFREGANNKMWFRDNNINEVLDKIVYAKRIKFTGGEPFLIPQVKIILEHLVKTDNAKNIILSFISNGTQDIKKWMPLLSKFKRIYMTVSVDAIGERFEYIRAGASWPQVKTNIEQLAKLHCHDFEVKISILPSILNYDNINEVVDWCNSINLPYHISNPVMYPKFMSPSAVNDPGLRQQFIEQMDIQDRIHNTDWRKFVNL